MPGDHEPAGCPCAWPVPRATGIVRPCAIGSAGNACGSGVRSAHEQTCVVNPCSVNSSGRRLAVLAEDPAKPISALDPPGRQWDHVGRLTGSALLDPLVWSGVIVVIDVLSQHRLQVPAAEDQHAVQYLTPGRAHPALRKCVATGLR